MRRIVVLLLAALVAVSLAPVVSAQEEDDQVTLRIGLTQDWETLNPTSGFAVSSFHQVAILSQGASRARGQSTPGTMP